ncbi:hypothetical protein BGX34_004437 [Mortierella sp. NVP85]|nr:hypothetical protein BGX34_004437 [Mortierella sp. NVP85]
MSSDSTAATLTIRLVKSFTHRTCKNLILKDIDLTTTTVAGLREKIIERMASEKEKDQKFARFLNVEYDTLKLYTKAYGAKTMNLAINLDHDEDWIMNDDEKLLVDYGIEHETEISYFNRSMYEEYKKNVVIEW